MIKRYKKNRNLNLNQKSFYFEDYLETNKKTKFSQKNNLFQDRIYLLFFLFISLVLIFSIRIIQVSFDKIDFVNQQNQIKNFNTIRRDIVDRNGALISRNINSFHAAINPQLITNKKIF